MRIFIYLIFVLSLGLSNLTQAATYKWVDEKGNTVYSQTPPPEQAKDYQRIKGLPKASRSSSTSPTPTATSTEASGGSGSASKETTEKAEATRQKNCETAKKNLELYTTYRRFPDKDGNMTRMDDDLRQKNIEESEQQIQDFCN